MSGPARRVIEGEEERLESSFAHSATRLWIAPLSTVAAAAMVIGVVALTVTYEPAVDFHVGGLGDSRVATMREVLREGERISIAYQRGEFGYIAVLSVDEDGEVSALYPETGESLPADGPSDMTRMLPDSVGFTGPGFERILVVLTDDPLSMELLGEATREALARADGALDAMGDLELGQSSEQFHSLVIKP